METQALDDLTHDGDVTAHRDRAKGMLNEIARNAKEALAEQAIDIDLFFIVPSSGPIVTFGTLLDPDDDLWNRVGEIVRLIVAQSIGLRGTLLREVRCATTYSRFNPPIACT